MARYRIVRIVSIDAIGWPHKAGGETVACMGSKHQSSTRITDRLMRNDVTTANAANIIDVVVIVPLGKGRNVETTNAITIENYHRLLI